MNKDTEKTYYMIELEKVNEVVESLILLIQQEGVCDEAISKVNKLKMTVNKLAKLTDNKMR